jgi:hypothetical protein
MSDRMLPVKIVERCLDTEPNLKLQVNIKSKWIPISYIQDRDTCEIRLAEKFINEKLGCIVWVTFGRDDKNTFFILRLEKSRVNNSLENCVFLDNQDASQLVGVLYHSSDQLHLLFCVAWK